MADHTAHHSIPYPEGDDQVAVHTDIEHLATKVDTELHHTTNMVRNAAEYAAEGGVPADVVNLFDFDHTIHGRLSPSGDVSDHDVDVVSDFIPVTPRVRYTSWATRLTRFVFYDSNHEPMPGSNAQYLVQHTQHHHVVPFGAEYIRIGVSMPSSGDESVEVIFNRGNTLWSPLEETESGWWDDRELPPNKPVNVEDLAFSENGRIGAQYLEGAVPERITNLFDHTKVVSGTLSESGAIHPHETNVVSEPIPVTPEEPYVSLSETSHRVVWFTALDQPISGTDTSYQENGEVASWIAPEGAAYALFGAAVPSTHTPETIGAVFNHGTTIWEPNKQVESGWWDDRELPPGSASIDHDEIQGIVESLLPQYEPSHPTLQFETVTTGWTDPLWLSSDGTVLFGRQGTTLLQSVDEWSTTETVHQFDGYPILAIRQLDNGELLVSTSRDESTGRKAKLWLTEGYNTETASITSMTEVLEAGATQANFNNSWGLHAYQNIVVASEYGLRGEEGARRVWLSEDHAKTWELVFDQMVDTANIDGAPTWTTSAHIHTAAWDPYWSRLWVVVGDSPNTATYYSDDKGQTWVYVEGSGGPAPAVQYTGIMPLPDVVLFGSDRAPNGVYAYRRGDKSDMPVIKPLLLVDDRDEITRVFQLPFKRDWNPTTPTYFAATPANNREPSVIVGTVDGKKAHVLWEGDHPDTGTSRSGTVHFAFGPTAQGNIVAVMGADPTITGRRTMKAPAPTWARA